MGRTGRKPKILKSTPNELKVRIVFNKIRFDKTQMRTTFFEWSASFNYEFYCALEQQNFFFVNSCKLSVNF